MVEGSPEEVAVVVTDLGAVVCKCIAPGVVLLRFGNSVGRIERAGGLGALSVHSGKWTEDDYDALLEDLSRVTAALPFASSSASSLPYERSEIDTQDVLYHAFIWLRHALLRESRGELRDAIEGILRHPHRRLVRISREVPVELAGRLGARALEDVAAGRWPVTESRLGFIVDGRRLLPERMTEDHPRESVDTAENRFVKAFLNECAWVVERVRTHIGAGGDSLARRVSFDCDRLAEILGPWRRASMWRAVGPMVHFPASSSVLQRRSEYRAVLRHHLMLRLGSRVPLEPTITRKLLESKDIATLYELWATFTIVDEVTAILGPPHESARVVVTHRTASVSRGLVVRWADGTALAYNHTYTRGQGFQGKSRSLQVRPDIALSVPGGPNAGLHLFDAKFRLKGTLDPEREAEDASYQHDDLHKMHAYRDAIPNARTAWVVYPGGHDEAFFDDGRRGLGAVKAGPLAGVGALSLRPAAGRAGLRAVLGAALAKPEAAWATPS